MRTARPAILIALGLSGCTAYRAEPLEERRILEELRAATPEGGKASVSARGEEAFEPADGLSEAEAVALALALNPELRVRRAERGLAEAQLLAAGLFPDPGLDATWIARSDGTLLEGALLQVLPLAGERGLRRDRARLRLEEADRETAWEEWRLAQEVRTAFVEAAAAEALVPVEREGLALRGRILAVLRARRDLGAAAPQDLDLPALEEARQRRALLQAECGCGLARQRLNRLLGLGPRTAYALQGAPLDAEASPLSRDLERMEEVAIARRPDLDAARLAYEQAERDLQLAVRGQMPRLRIGPAYNREASDDGFGIGAGIELPLWNRNRGEVAEKLAQRARLAEAFRARLSALRVELAGAQAQADLLDRQLRAFREEVRPGLERSLALAEEVLRAGKAAPADLLAVQDRFLEARREELGLKAGVRKARIRLEEALGAALQELEHDKEEGK